MKSLKFMAGGLIIFLCFVAPVAGSYFGYTGLNFIPVADVLQDGEYSVSYYSEPARLDIKGRSSIPDIIPYSSHIAIGLGGNNRWELGLTSTPFYSKDFKQTGRPEVFSLYIPLPTAIKVLLLKPTEETSYASLSMGLACPYGGYAVVGFDLLRKIFRIHLGFSSNIIIHWGVFAGSELGFPSDFGPISRFKFIFETHTRGTLGGNEKPKGFGHEFWGPKYNDDFYSGALRYHWRYNLNIDLGIRYSSFSHPDPEVKLDNPNVTHIFLGLSYYLQQIDVEKD